jgi:hypothetical protein
VKLTQRFAGALLMLLGVQFALIFGSLIASAIIEVNDNRPGRMIIFLLQLPLIILSFITYMRSLRIFNLRREELDQIALRYGGRVKGHFSSSFRREYYAVSTPGIPGSMSPLASAIGLAVLFIYLLVSIIGLFLAMSGNPAARLLENLDSTYHYQLLLLPFVWGLFSLPHALSLWRETSQAIASPESN